AGLSDDAVAGLREQAREPFAEQEVVVGDDDGTAYALGLLRGHAPSMRDLGENRLIRGRRSTSDLERQREWAALRDERRDLVPVDDVRDRFRDDGREAELPKLLRSPGVDPDLFALLVNP